MSFARLQIKRRKKTYLFSKDCILLDFCVSLEIRESALNNDRWSSSSYTAHFSVKTLKKKGRLYII